MKWQASEWSRWCCYFILLESSTSQRELVERGWMDLSLFLQKNLPIRDWKFIIRELFCKYIHVLAVWCVMIFLWFQCVDAPDKYTRVLVSYTLKIVFEFCKYMDISHHKWCDFLIIVSVGKTADHVIEEHEANHQRNVREQIYCCLITFSQRTDMCSFDLQKLVDILSNHEHTELATSIQNDERFTVLFPNMSSENSDTEFSDVSRNQWCLLFCALTSILSVEFVHVFVLP